MHDHIQRGDAHALTELVSHPGDLWSATASEPAEHPALDGHIEVDVAVIGAGILGLSTALALAEGGQSVAVLEAARIGHGASGRNGGLVVPSLPRVGPDDVIASMGEARGGRFVRTVLGAPDEVFGLVRRFSIACGAEQSGWLNPAHGAALVPLLQRRLAAWQHFGGTATLLSREQTALRTGSHLFHAAISDPTGGHLNPLSYTRGLARAASANGARVFQASPVRRIERHADRWKLVTDRGTVAAMRVVQATNAQPPGTPGAAAAARSTIPLRVFQLATQVLSSDIRATILPGGEALSDTRHNLFACCIDSSGRLVTGGMAPLTQIGAGTWLPAMLARRLLRVFPQLGSVRFEYVWSGQASLTPDFLPRLFEVAPGWIVPFTCNGRGVALSDRDRHPTRAVARDRRRGHAPAGDCAAGADPLSRSRCARFRNGCCRWAWWRTCATRGSQARKLSRQ